MAESFESDPKIAALTGAHSIDAVVSEALVNQSLHPTAAALVFFGAQSFASGRRG